MKRYLAFLLLGSLIAACEKEEEFVRADAEVMHTGARWTITSMTYDLIDQTLSGQTISNGTVTNPGFFFFDGDHGSFEFTVEKIRKEDVFSYQENNGEVDILTIAQSAGAGTFSQNIIVLSGEKPADSAMTLSGTITRQSGSGQFILTASFVLAKD